MREHTTSGVGTDASAVRSLRDEARRRLRDGDQAGAIHCLDRALHEDPDDDMRADLLVEIAVAEARINPLRAAERYHLALTIIDDPRERLPVAVRRARSLASAGLVTDALEQLDAARREVDDPALALRADLAYVAVARQSLDTRPLGRARMARISSSASLTHKDASPQVFGELAYELALSGTDHREVVRAALTALGGEDLSALHDLQPFTRHATLLALCWSGELGTAHAAANLVLAGARRRGIDVDVAAAHELLANVDWRRGDLTRTIAYADHVIADAAGGVPTLLIGAIAFRSMALAEQGRIGDAIASLNLAGDVRRWSSFATYHGYLIGAARTHLLAGEFRQAHRLALQCGTLATSMGTENPAVLPWREIAAHAAAAMGLHAEAADLALDAVERATAFGAAGPIAIALRALAAASEDDAVTVLRDAMTYVAASDQRLEAAHIELDLARALAATGDIDGARQHALQARELADELGARLLEAEASTIIADLEVNRLPPPARRAPSTRRAHLHVLGGFVLTDAAGVVSTPAGVPGKAIRVLAAAATPLHLEQLADHLWDGVPPPERLRARLRNVIARTRIGDRPAIRRDGDVVYLDKDVTVDAVQFEDACARALAAPEADALEATVAATLAYGGDLLPSDPYAEWATLPRERLRLRYLMMCDRAARLATAVGLHDLALDRLQAAIRHDPYDTERYLQAATILTATGDDTGAAAMRERERRVRAAFDS